MTEELQAISVGLGVDLGRLDRDLAAIEKKIKPIKGPHKVTFIVGAPDLRAVQHQLRQVLQAKYVVTPSIGVSRASVREFRRSLNAELLKESPGGIPIKIKANLSPGEIARIKREIITKLGTIPLTVAVQGGGPTTAAPASQARAQRPQATPVATAAPARPVTASAPAAAAPVAPARPAVVPVAPARSSARPTAQRATAGAGTGAGAPATAAPSSQGGRRVEIRRNAETGRDHRFDAATGEDLGPVRATGTPGYLQKRSERQGRVSTESSRGRVFQPETPEEIEYANRPRQVGLPRDAQAEFEQEKRGRGVRGASRSGAMRRGEAPLSAERRLDIDMMQDVEDVANVERRNAEIAGPARKSRAFYGKNLHPRLRDRMLKFQFYAFDPKLGEAFGALSAGDTGLARETLRGFSAQLATADPRKRKKFFRLFTNVENVPPELLEKHSALQSLFTEIAKSEADKRLEAANSAMAAFPRPKGPQSGWSDTQVGQYKALLDQVQTARAWQMDVLRGLARRAGGGPVQGGGLLARIKAREAMEKGTIVGEHRPETYVSKSGVVEVVGEHGPSIATFPEDGQIVPFVPPWLRNLKAKDLTHRAGGGPVRGFGGSKFRAFAPGEKEAISSGLLTAAGSADVQRVFVVNMPSSGFGPGGIVSDPRGQTRAAGPFRFGTDKDAAKFAEQLGGTIGKQLKDVLGLTEPVRPERPERETPVGPLTAAERVASRSRARRATTTQRLEETVLQARSATTEAQQLIPVRSLSVAVGQIFSTVFGGRGDALSRAKAANDLAAKATVAVSNFKAEQQKLVTVTTQLRKAENPRQQTELIEKVRDQAKATREARNEAEGLAAQAKTASENVIHQGGALRNLAAGTLGVVGGTILFSAALGAAQVAIDAGTRALGPAIDRLLGFGAVSSQVTDHLADQIRQQDGATKTTIALTAAQAGLSKQSSDLIANEVGRRSEVEAGNKALKESLDLLHTAEAVRRQNVGAPSGERGLTQYTGGILGTGVFGTPGTEEQVANELAGVPSQAQVNEEIRTGPKLFGLIDVPFRSMEEAIAERDAQIAVGNQRLEFFNSQIEKGGEGFKFVAQHTLQLDDATREAAAAAADLAGARNLASNIRAGQTILVDRFGEIVTEATDFRDTLVAINKGFTIPDPKLLLDALTERIIPAQRSQFRAEGIIQRGLIPGRAALQQLAAPTPGLTGGPSFGAGLTGFNVTGKLFGGGEEPFSISFDAQAAKAAEAYRSKVGRAVEDVNALIEQGVQDMIDLVPPETRAEFTGLLADIQATGQAISDIEIGIQQQQSDLALAEYNNSLRIAHRSLKDAKDLQAGIAGETRNTLGGIEGMNIALQRQLQLLSFELQQRQINFRLATAGFVAPGTTPEERAARIKAAKEEAAFAQKQLDLQRQIAANQQKAITITADRNVTDVLAQIRLLEQAHVLDINTAAANRALDILNKKQQLLLEKAGTYIEEGVKIVTAASQAASEVQRQTGKGFAYLLSETAKAWGIFGTQAQTILDRLRGTAPQTGPGSSPYGSGPGGPPPDGYASGIVFDSSGPTDITVGEAGRERVAVLKNPQRMTLSQLMSGTREYLPTLAQPGVGGGGGWGGNVNITVVVTGNTITKDTDIHELAEEIAEKAAQKAEERMLRKANLLSGRRV